MNFRSYVYYIRCCLGMMYCFKMSTLFGSHPIKIPWHFSRTSHPNFLTSILYFNTMAPTQSVMLPILQILDSTTLERTRKLNIYLRRCCITQTWSWLGIRTSRYWYNCCQNIVHYSGWMSKCWAVTLRCFQASHVYIPMPSDRFLFDVILLGTSSRHILGGYHYHRKHPFMMKFVRGETDSYIFHMWVSLYDLIVNAT